MPSVLRSKYTGTTVFIRTINSQHLVRERENSCADFNDLRVTTGHAKDWRFKDSLYWCGSFRPEQQTPFKEGQASVLMQLTSMNEKSKSQIIRKYIAKILMSDLASPDLQLIIAQILLELSILPPVTVMLGSLYPWFLASKNVILPDFVSKLKQTRFLVEKQGNTNP